MTSPPFIDLSEVLESLFRQDKRGVVARSNYYLSKSLGKYASVSQAEVIGLSSSALDVMHDPDDPLTIVTDSQSL